MMDVKMSVNAQRVMRHDISSHNNYKTPDRMNHSATEIASKLLESIHKTCINNRRSKTTKRSSVNCDDPPHKSSLAGYFS